MFRPQIQNTKVLVLLAVFAIASVYWVANSSNLIEKEDLDIKNKAVDLMIKYTDSLKELTIKDLNSKDLYKTGLLGVEQSAITTIQDSDEKNYLDSKIACTHPNFASLVIHMLREAELDDGDTIAISMTGSFPGANLAVIAACSAMNIKPIILSSVGSSAWGANRENITWVDMETHLLKNNLIDFQSLGVSIGGENDLGENLTNKGIDIIEDNILINDRLLINESTLKENIDYKLELYASQLPIDQYKAFINIGGGTSSIGYGTAKDSMKVGVIFPIETSDIIDNDIYFKGSLAHNFLQNDVTFINIKNINLLAESWELYPPNVSIEEFEGSLFYDEEKYNFNIIVIALLFNLIIIISIGVHSHNQIKKRMRNEEYDAIL